MSDSLRHRGPDSAGGLLRPGRVGLGFRRLSIIDLETGDQPISNEAGTVHVTCNGEIYNFRELRGRLVDSGHVFSTRSDTEVIVHLYEELGPSFVDELEGMFAVALWDDRAERLVLARDRLGVKPLYWAPLEQGLLYASEPRGIIASGQVDPRPDLRALARYLTLQYVPSPASGFAGIRKLAPGERLVYSQGRAQVERYWSLEFSPRQIGLEDAVTELDQLLADATRKRLVADVPLGAFLSGGVDSSVVVSYMAEAATDVKTFSIDFEEDAFSENEHAQRVAARFGTDHRSETLSPDILGLVDRVVEFAGEPFADSSAVPTMLLSGFTRENVTVALSGDGGDEAFAGYRRYMLSTAADRMGIARPAARVLARIVRGRVGRLGDTEVARAIDAAARTPDDRYAKLMSHFDPAELSGLCTPEFLSESGGVDAWAEDLKPPEGLNGVNRYLALDTATYLPGDLLVKLDRMSMAHALEVRSPLLDYRVFEFAATLPAGLKLRRGGTKVLLKELARRRGVPSSVVDRRKQGFGMPVGAWMRGPLRGWVRDLLLGEEMRGRGWFVPARVERLVAEHVDEGRNHTARLWNLAMLESWNRHFCDR